MMNAINQYRMSDLVDDIKPRLVTGNFSQNSFLSASRDVELFGEAAWVEGAAVDILSAQAGSDDRAQSRTRDAILVRLPLSAASVHRCTDDDGLLPDIELRANEALLLDLSKNPRVWLTASSRWLHVGLDQRFLEGIADRAGGHSAGVMARLRAACGRAISDPILHELCASLALLVGEEDPRALFIRKQILAALAGHLLFSYGQLDLVSFTARGGLAPWQVRKSQEKMRARLREPLNLEQIAKDCGLSLSHFSRAFRCSVGMPPYAWRVRQRVKFAKDLMQCPDKPLAEIAIECGFADQSHFTRVFLKETGASPGNWRRLAIQRPSSS